MDMTKFAAICEQLSKLSDAGVTNFAAVIASSQYSFLNTPETAAAVELFPVLKAVTAIVKG